MEGMRTLESSFQLPVVSFPAFSSDFEGYIPTASYEVALPAHWLLLSAPDPSQANQKPLSESCPSS